MGRVVFVLALVAYFDADGRRDAARNVQRSVSDGNRSLSGKRILERDRAAVRIERERCVSRDFRSALRLFRRRGNLVEHSVLPIALGLYHRGAVRLERERNAGRRRRDRRPLRRKIDSQTAAERKDGIVGRRNERIQSERSRTRERLVVSATERNTDIHCSINCMASGTSFGRPLKDSVIGTLFKFQRGALFHTKP